MELKHNDQTTGLDNLSNLLSNLLFFLSFQNALHLQETSLLKWLQQWVVEWWNRVDQPAFWDDQPLRMTNFQNDQPFGIGQLFRMALVVEQWSKWCKRPTPSNQKLALLSSPGDGSDFLITKLYYLLLSLFITLYYTTLILILFM